MRKRNYPITCHTRGVDVNNWSNLTSSKKKVLIAFPEFESFLSKNEQDYILAKKAAENFDEEMKK